MDLTTVIIILLVGAVPGFIVGRWSAEYRRARADMRGIWKGRRKYRGG